MNQRGNLVSIVNEKEEGNIRVLFGHSYRPGISKIKDDSAFLHHDLTSTGLL